MTKEVCQMCVNPGKNEFLAFEQEHYACYAIPTRVITAHDKLTDIVTEYASPVLRPGDVLFLSEKMAACTQGRAIPLSQIQPTRLARFLSRHVTKNSCGIGLAIPETMQCAINECGVPRILVAAAAGMLGKLLHRKGWFYHIAGYQAAGIDGPCDYTLPPYNQYVVLTPSHPDRLARCLARQLCGVHVLIVDINDLGGRILGRSSRSLSRRKYAQLLGQNPLGQSDEQTPMGILRPLA